MCPSRPPSVGRHREVRSTLSSPRAEITGAHLVGSLNLPSTEEVFRTVAAHLGGELTTMPDGETGERFYWLLFQSFRFDRTPGLVRVGDEPILLRGQYDQRPFALDGSVAVEDVHFPDLGYASAALDSYARLLELKAAGVVPPDTRFQMALPTPAGVVGLFFVPALRASLEPVYARALYAELDRVLAVIPHEDLSVQWDSPVEFIWLEGASLGGVEFLPWWDDTLGGIVERAAQQASRLPDAVGLGFHLCYGDVEEQHFVQPVDTGNLARVMTRVADVVTRRIDYFHLPVPIDRDDPAYYAPLKALELREGTLVHLGLVHPEDGVDGALRRIAAASTALQRFGIATECGFGRGPAERTVPLLDLHRQVINAARR